MKVPRDGRASGRAKWLAVMIAFAAVATPALAAPTRPPAQPAPTPVHLAADVETAEKLYSKLDYDEANKVAERALMVKGLTHDQLTRGYRILALTHAVLDHEDAARDAFIQLLTFNPDFAVDPNLGPRVSTPFMEARGFWRSQPSKPGLEVSTVLRPQDTGTLRITTRDPTHIVQGILLGYRWGASSSYTSKPAAIGDAVVVEIAPPPVGASRLDYYAQAFDERDNVVMEVGNPSSPKSAMVDMSLVPPPQTPIDFNEHRSVFKSPIFWTLAIAALAAGGVGGYFLLKPKDPGASSMAPATLCGPDPCH